MGFNIKGYELGLLPEENGTDKKADRVISYWGVEDIQKVYNHLIEWELQNMINQRMLEVN